MVVDLIASRREGLSDLFKTIEWFTLFFFCVTLSQLIIMIRYDLLIYSICVLNSTQKVSLVIKSTLNVAHLYNKFNSTLRVSESHSLSLVCGSFASFVRFARGVAIDVIVSAAVVSRELVLSACTAEKTFVLMK